MGPSPEAILSAFFDQLVKGEGNGPRNVPGPARGSAAGLEASGRLRVGCPPTRRPKAVELVSAGGCQRRLDWGRVAVPPGPGFPRGVTDCKAFFVPADGRPADYKDLPAGRGAPAVPRGAGDSELAHSTDR